MGHRGLVRSSYQSPTMSPLNRMREGIHRNFDEIEIFSPDPVLKETTITTPPSNRSSSPRLNIFGDDFLPVELLIDESCCSPSASSTQAATTYKILHQKRNKQNERCLTELVALFNLPFCRTKVTRLLLCAFYVYNSYIWYVHISGNISIV